MTNRFKGLDLIDRVPEELWTEVCNIVQEKVIEPSPRKRNAKRQMVVWGGLTNSWEKKRSERQRRKGRYTHLYAEFQRIARRDKKAFLTEQCKEIEETIEWERLEVSSRKLEILRERWLIGKDSDAGRDWGQEEKGTTEDEMAGWHHGLDGHESEWTPGVGDGHGGLACCDSWGCKELDTTERLNWTELKGTFHAKMGAIKDRNCKDLTEAENIKRWQEYTEEVYKKILMTQITTMVLSLT